MRRLCAFMIATALIVGTTNCSSPVEDESVQYTLTVSSTTGGGVTIPGEGTFTYHSGVVVNLVATPHTGYRFGEWVGGVETISDINAVAATITMNGDYSLVAAFEERPVHRLTITSTEGGLVQVPGEGSFAHHEGTVVNLIAEPEPGYRFVNWSGNVATIVNVNAAETTITIDGDCTIAAVFQKTRYTPMVAAGMHHTVGLKSDGTVVAVGRNDAGQCEVGLWTDIVQIAAGVYHTVGLKSDGTVVTVGRNDAGQCEVGLWTDIVQIAAGPGKTIGLRSNRTVVAVGGNYWGECEVGLWADIVQVAAGWTLTAGLKTDGTVVTAGHDYKGQRDVGDWTHIVRIAAGYYRTAGLKSDGTVRAVGDSGDGHHGIAHWDDIIEIAASSWHTVGIKVDKTVIALGYNQYGQCDVYQWKDIMWIAAGGAHTVGLKADGTVVAVGANDYGQCDVGGWNLVG